MLLTLYDEQVNITRMTFEALTIPESKLVESSTVVVVVLTSQSLEVEFWSQAENINYQQCYIQFRRLKLLKSISEGTLSYLKSLRKSLPV